MAAAGRLDRRCAFERRATAADGYGTERGAWAALLTVWGRLRIERPAERLAGAAERPAERAELQIRASAATWAITEADRVVIDGVSWRLIGRPVETIPRSGALSLIVEREG